MRQKTKKWLRYLPRFGCICTGIIYGSVGVLALLSFFKVRHGGADEGSFLVILDQYAWGRIVIWLIIGGMLSFIFWRFFEAFKDPYGYGRDVQGMVKRIGAALSTTADAFIAYTALQALYSQQKAPEDGTPKVQRQMAADLLEKDGGSILLAAGGGIIFITALVLVFYILSRNFRERINLEKLKGAWRPTVKALAYGGYLSRSFILGIVGFFYAKAGIEENAQQVVNTDKAFDFIGDHIGHPFFIITAVGTICYGLYMFALGRHYDVDKD